MPGRRALTVVAAVLFLTAMMCSPPSSNGGAPEAAAAASPLPRLHGDTVQGGTADTTRMRGGVLVVNVWATWCGPCEREQPALESVAKAYASRGVRFLGLNERDNLDAAKTWIARHGVTYPSISDPSGAFADDLGFLGYPDTYVVDPSGTIRFVIAGEATAQEVSGAIDQVLAASATPSPSG
jgi:cytochrome c biogenesis protein CcmG, thiol:disulfide interchange protein DsbE